MTRATQPPAPTLTVSEVLAAAERGVAAEMPGPLWVRGEVTGFRRTSGGAAFFRLADPDHDEAALDVAARGRVMRHVDAALSAAGMGALRDGITVRLRGTVGIARRQSLLRLSLLEVDLEFTLGRLALDRARVLEAMAADGSLAANRALPLPLVPLRVGLVTSRGSAAHADFLSQLSMSGHRFSVRTAHASVQGERAPEAVAAAVARMSAEPVDVVVVIRGGGSKLDLAAFDTEVVGRAIASCPVTVITGIGHEVDSTVADEAAAVALKTPTAAAEWLISRVGDYASRIDSATYAIGNEARSALGRASERWQSAAGALAIARQALGRQRDILGHEAEAIAHTARSALERRRRELASLAELVGAVGIDETLARGFALVTRNGEVVRSTASVTPGERLTVRLSDGEIGVVVDANPGFTASDADADSPKLPEDT